MFDKSQKLQETLLSDMESEAGPSAKDEAARLFTLALDEAHWARQRAQNRTRVIGIHGTDFESRDARAESVVEKFNERAVKTARKNALRAGWTKEQLVSLEQNDAVQGFGTARAGRRSG